MWTVLKKELREGWLFLLINILVLAGTPPMFRLFWPRHWDADVNAIFYAIMFGVFVPLYLVILAAGLVLDENTFLVRGLPVKPWKVAGGKLLYLALNFFVLELICLVWYLQELRWPTGELELDLLFSLLWLGITAVTALTAFTFATFLPRKSYAFFSALLGTILAAGSLIYLISHYPQAVLEDRAIQTFLGMILLLICVAPFILYRDLLRQSRRRWVRALAAVILLPAVAGVLWLRAPLWLKQCVIGNPNFLQPVGANLFVSYHRWGPFSEPYLFNASTGDLRPFPFLGRNELIVGTDAARNVVYTAVRMPVKRNGSTFYKYSSIDPQTGTTRDLGLLPQGWKHFRGDIVYWQTWDGRKTEEFQFGFKNLIQGKIFEFTLPKGFAPIWGQEGVLFETSSPQGTLWKFVDYATLTPREAFQGEYFRWPWGDGSGFFLFQGKRDANEKIPYDQDCFRWDPRSGDLQRLGPGRPVFVQGDEVVLLRGKEGESKSLVLYRKGREISSLHTEFQGGYTYGSEWDYFYENRIENSSRITLWADKDRKSKSIGTLAIIGNQLDLKISPFTTSNEITMPIPESEEVLLFIRTRSSKSDWDSLYRVYRLNPTTGKKRRLV